MKTKFLSLLLLSALSASLFAQSPAPSGGGGGGDVSSPDSFPAQLPISSPGLMISNAKPLVKWVAGSASSRGFVYGAKGVNTYFEKAYVPSIPGQPDLVEMAALVPMSSFTFETSNPADPIQVSVYFRDNTGRALFEGSVSFKLVEAPDGSFAPPSSHISVPVWPSGDLPLEISGADRVQLALLNEQGETTDVRNLERDRNGAFLFPSWLAGQKYVQLTATDYRDDGTTHTAVYTAEDGKRQPIVKSAVVASVSFQNVVIVPTDIDRFEVKGVEEQSAKAFRNGVSPSVQLRFTRTQTFLFYAEHPSGEVARGFWIRGGSATSEWSYKSIKKGYFTELYPSLGVYDIVIDWPTFGRREGPFGERFGPVSGKS